MPQIPSTRHSSRYRRSRRVAKITDKYNANNHVMGGTIMGRNPNDSVVDADCRTHDHENLYIAGGATMPSSSCINSTLSMVAVSLRMADRLKSAMKS